MVMNNTLNISVPENLKSYITQRVKGGDFSNVSDYIRTLVRRDQEQVLAKQAADTQKWSLIHELAQQRLQKQLADVPPAEFAELDEDQVMQMVREEVTAYRQQK